MTVGTLAASTCSYYKKQVLTLHFQNNYKFPLIYLYYPKRLKSSSYYILNPRISRTQLLSGSWEAECDLGREYKISS